MRELQLQHGVRGGGLPQYRRVLEGEARDGDDFGRGVHRACTFCNVATGRPDTLDRTSPRGWLSGRRARPQAHRRHLGRPRRSGGWRRRPFCATIAAIRGRRTGNDDRGAGPDFLRKDGAIETVIAAKPDVLNHNLETVPRLYAEVRPGARYFHSLRLLDQARRLDPTVSANRDHGRARRREGRSAAGEDDLRAAEVDFLTIGQYLQPTPKHHPIARFVTPEEFESYRGWRSARAF